jgi:hypothetical protein
MNKELESTLKSINISYLFAKNLEHGISYQRSNWELFEPSKFIYSFFTFNMLYEINWEETLSRVLIPNTRRKDFTSNKIILLLKFIYSHLDDFSFISFYKKYDTELSIIDNSKSIRRDINILKKDKTTFLRNRNTYLENFTTALKNLKKGNISIEDHYKLIIFCYQVRNNIFHGLKKATEMIESGQRDRLHNYSQILLATIEMFFEILKAKHNYRLATEDELKENAKISY